MNKECNIVQDLIPLCAEKIASEDSIKFVEEHCSQCSNCKRTFELTNESFKNKDFEKENEQKVKKIWENIEKQEKQKNRKKWFMRSICTVLFLIFTIFTYSFYITGNVWFVNVDCSAAENYPTESQHINFSQDNLPSKKDVSDAADAVKKYFHKNMNGFILTELTYQEDLTLDKNYSNGNQLVFRSTYYVLFRTPVRESGETVTYWNWYMKYDSDSKQWVVDGYGFG